MRRAHGGEVNTERPTCERRRMSEVAVCLFFKFREPQSRDEANGGEHDDVGRECTPPTQRETLHGNLG